VLVLLVLVLVGAQAARSPWLGWRRR
jgi:hypothetical protein